MFEARGSQVVRYILASLGGKGIDR
jgi:hypothetical protein